MSTKAPQHQTYFRLSELATSPATPAKEYIDPKGIVRNISAKAANKGITPLARSTILRWANDGRFPAPNRSMKGITIWNASQVFDWLEKLGHAANDGGGSSSDRLLDQPPQK